MRYYSAPKAFYPLLVPTTRRAQTHSSAATSNTLSSSKPSTVQQGTHYEHLTLRSLHHYGIDLTRTGGRADHGIDLVGRWWLPSDTTSLTSLPILFQCKSITRRPSPSLIRELEGAAAAATLRDVHLSSSAQPSYPQPGAAEPKVRPLAFLVTPQPATQGIRNALRRSKWPLGYVRMCEESGRIEGWVWNRVALRASPSTTDGKDDGKETPLASLTTQVRYVLYRKRNVREVVVLWGGSVWDRRAAERAAVSADAIPDKEPHLINVAAHEERDVDPVASSGKADCDSQRTSQEASARR